MSAAREGGTAHSLSAHLIPAYPLCCRVRDAGGGQEAVQAAYEQSMKSACIPECDPLRPVTTPEARLPVRKGPSEGAGSDARPSEEEKGPRVYRPRHTAPPEPQVSMWELLQGPGAAPSQPSEAGPAEAGDGDKEEQDPVCPACEEEAGQ